MTPLETYLRELRDIRSSGAGVKETSYYPALSNLLNEVGRRLKPCVRCIINLANRGTSLLDIRLFTSRQTLVYNEDDCCATRVLLDAIRLLSLAFPKEA